jgi:hypothetical protein
LFFQSLALGVGQEPEPFAVVRGAHVVSAQHCPARVIPERGKLSENGSEVRLSKESWDVLQEHVAGSYLANNAAGVRPEVAVVGCPGAWTCGTPGLARKARMDNVHAAMPGRPGKVAYVVPDREGGQEAVPLALHEHTLTVGVDLDGADRNVSHQEATEEAAAAAGEEVQGS